MTKQKLFPILHPGSDRIRRMGDEGAQVLLLNIPWEMIEPHAKQAKLNHDQSLERLAERGGLDANEAIAVLTDKGIIDIPVMEDRFAYAKLFALVQEWSLAQASALLHECMADDAITAGVDTDVAESALAGIELGMGEVSVTSGVTVFAGSGSLDVSISDDAYASEESND